MAIQSLIQDVKARVDNARKPYREAFKAYVDVQKKALGVLTNGAQSLAKTETNAAKDVFAAARASFDKARKDGVRQVASKPQAYVPESRDSIVTAYKETLELLVKTGNELGDVVGKGYKKVFNKLNGKKSPAGGKTARRKTASNKATPKKTAAKKAPAKKAAGNSAARKPAAKRATPATKTTATGTQSDSTGDGASAS